MTATVNQLSVYYSYACRDSYLVFRWLQHLRSGQVLSKVAWKPYALRAGESPGYWDKHWEQAGSELRGFIAAEAARQQGDAAFIRFHEQLERAVHQDLKELGDEETLLEAAANAELDTEAFKRAVHDPNTAAGARRNHEEADERYGVYGTPTIVFPSGAALHVELGDIPDEETSLRMFPVVSSIAEELPVVGQLKRTGVGNQAPNTTCDETCDCCGSGDEEALITVTDGSKSGASCGPECVESGTCTCE